MVQYAFVFGSHVAKIDILSIWLKSCIGHCCITPTQLHIRCASLGFTCFDWCNIHHWHFRGLLTISSIKFLPGNLLCVILISFFDKMGKFDWGSRYVIIFLCVQFWIRLAAVRYRGKNVRTVASPAVRSVNKSRDTLNCVQNKPEYAISVICTTRLYYKALGVILCDLI